MARAFLFYRIALVLLILGAVIIPQAFAVEDLWTGRKPYYQGRLFQTGRHFYRPCRPDECDCSHRR